MRPSHRAAVLSWRLGGHWQPRCPAFLPARLICLQGLKLHAFDGTWEATLNFQSVESSKAAAPEGA